MSNAQDLLAILMAPAPPEPPKPAPFVKRFFYRCVDCLTVAATLTKIPDSLDKWYQSTREPNALCDACGGKIEFMGETHRHVLQATVGYEPACNGKCISAPGPNCDCKCGGANHGSGLVVPVIQTSEIPRLGIGGDKARLAGETWRTLVARYKAAWTARYGSLVARKRAGDYLYADEFARYCESNLTSARYNHILHGRTTARAKKLESLILEMGAK